ncbi:MAG: 3-deoxy-7-phosphoheptulonate synthase [Clostridia bacterium]|nr:3-deoxy-7-phosphoheptulonate synthase [Clostridia bacterium]
MGANYIRKLPIPMEIKAQYPLTDNLAKIKAKRDKEIKAVFEGKSDKFILIVGPCSADNKDSVLDYMGRLKTVADEVKDKIIVIPRVYTNKPRTTGDGYLGMLHQPKPTEKEDMLKGIVAIREIHMSAIRDYGFTCADEMLYPENFRYLSDILGYVAVGARSVENQQHRLTASGIDVPVGMKNPTGGDMTVMMNSIVAASHPHTFIFRGWEVESTGNPLAHSILRGFTDRSGKYISNYHYEDLVKLNELYMANGKLIPAAIIDANHANSGKNPFEQPRIVEDVLLSRKKNADIKGLVKGVMIESYIEDGCQSPTDKVYGKSITDACLGFEKTKELIYEIADKL